MHAFKDILRLNNQIDELLNVTKDYQDVKKLAKEQEEEIKKLKNEMEEMKKKVALLEQDSGK